MRLDAREGDGGYYVFHVPTCRPVPDVLWVDDETRQYFVVAAYLMASDVYVGEVETAERIIIDQQRKLVLIDPVDDEPSPTIPNAIPILNGVF